MKINPRILKPKLAATSQHAANDGTRITTAVNPIRASRVTLFDPLAFGLDLGGLNVGVEEGEEEEEEEEEVSKVYYVDQVCVFCPPW